MKYAIVLLIILPLISANILSSISHFFHGDELKSVVNKILQAVGSDPARHVCESACHAALTTHPIASATCGPICGEFKTLVNHFHLK